MQWAVVFVALVVRAVVARRGNFPPLGSEETHKRPSKSAECQIGGEVKELRSTWYADLGPPFGVMYCIKCECVPVQKKRKIIGKVHCRNIKNECPKPTCDEPVLHPGKCCKVCPEDTESSDIAQDVTSLSEDDDKNMKYFASVLTGDGTATGRFSFHKRSLYFSFYATMRPSVIQFLDPSGNIIEEQELGVGSVYQNATDKICGVWRRVPRDYRRLIRKEQLAINIMSADKKKNMAGQIYRYRTLQTEMYSALLTGDGPGSGGTAIVSVSTTPPSIHIMAVFAGTIFSKEDAVDAPVNIRLATSDDETVVLNEIVKIPKASPDLNTVEVSMAVSGSDLRLLSRNKLRFAITSRTSGRAIDGFIRPRAVCETFQALMKPGEGEEAAAGESAGIAWLFVDKNGRLDFHVRIDRVTRPVIIGLVTERRLMELEDLSPELTSNGWTNGSLEAPAPKYLEMLYAGELGVNVATQTSKSVIKGKLTGKYVASPIDTKAPLLLTNEGLTRYPENTQLSALAWIDLDMDCNLHYEVELTKEGDYSLYLLHVPLDLPGAPETRHLLVSGSNHMEGSSLNLLPKDLVQLDSGVIKLEVKHSTGKLLLRALWPEVHVPDACLPNSGAGSLRNDLDPGSILDDPMPLAPPTLGPCLHEGVYHEEGSQWRSNSDPCTVCHCLIGQLTCEPLVCPPLPANCPRHLPKGQCCPICHNETTPQDGRLDEATGCQMAGQFYTPSSSWHPYLPPHGFDVCTTCMCHANDLRVTCSRTTCPPLTCDERVAVKPDKRSCCKVCPTSQTPDYSPPINLDAMIGEQGVTESPEAINEEILAQGGCKYPVGGPYHNGQQWHPRLYSHGEVKCVKCRCKDGKVKCERKRCTKWSCNDECCMAQCKRRRRNIRRHH
ncbi:short gastrulation [Nesidiocoris tenuis]|uniref:Short gastrulation n=1 Tax=Nesidiocoris tenuis TaxID=355587 RepID=A0ABN7BGE6_9HEMI|nr:short gastrulation [Nesidiocoris tenuis]